MATIEREGTTRIPPPRPRPERPVFVAEDDQRARWLRRGAAATAGLACLWLAGLGVGLLGFWEMPSVSLPAFSGDGGRKVAPEQTSGKAVGPAPSSAAVPARSPEVQARERPTPIEARVARSRAPSRAPAMPPTRRPVSRLAPPAQTQVLQPQAVPIPPPSQRPGVRRGWTIPPGQTRRAQAPPAPQTPPGQSRRRGGETVTTEATTTTAHEPPGQQKAPGLKD